MSVIGSDIAVGLLVQGKYLCLFSYLPKVTFLLAGNKP
jgi:hypothetical protein